MHPSTSPKFVYFPISVYYAFKLFVNIYLTFYNYKCFLWLSLDWIPKIEKQ